MSTSETPQMQESMAGFFAGEKKKQDLSRIIDEERSEFNETRQGDSASGMELFFKEKAVEQRMKTTTNDDARDHFASTKKFYKANADARNVFTQKGLNDRDKEQLFLKFYDENLKLKERDTKLEQNIKELKTKLRVIEGEFAYTRRRLEGDKGAKEDLRFIEDLKYENLSLKQRLDDVTKTHKLPMVGTKPQKILVKTTNKPLLAKTQQEHLRLIDLLKAQLRKSQSEIETLHAQLHSGNKSVRNEPTASAREREGNMKNDVHEKNIKITALQSRFENLENGYTAQKQTLDKTRQMLEEAQTQSTQDKNRILNLETQVRVAELAAHTAKDLQLQVDETNREKRKLEATIKDLTSTPFFRDLEHTTNPERLKTVEAELKDLEIKLRSLTDQNGHLEKTIVDLKQANEKVNIERERLKEENSRLHATMDERERNKGFIEEQMKLLHLNTDEEKDNFLKALGLVKLKGEEPAWMKLDFIERSHEVNTSDIPSLLKEIDRLRMEKSELAAQLEKSQTLLKTHLEIEKEKQIINETDKQKLELQLKASQHRIDELVKLSDFRRRGGDDNRYPADKLYDDNVSEFSDITESELHAGENTMDLFIGECELDEFVLRKLIGNKIPDVKHIQTLLTVDFYNHDTQSSNIVEGLRPFFNFQLCYRVMVDDFFLRYLETDNFRVEIYASVGSDVTLLGYVTIPLQDLVLKNYNASFGASAVVTTSGVIQGILKNEIVGVMKMRFRMRHSIIEAIRWYREKNELIGEKISDTKNYLMDPTISTRKIVINVLKGHGLDPRSSTFIYYKFFNVKDTYTSTVPGKDPVYDSLHTHDIPYNESLKNYLKSEYVEFLVFDDSIPYRSPEGDRSTIPNDVVGTARVRLISLLDDSPIDEVVPVYNSRGNRVADIHVKLYWYDVDVKRDMRRGDTKLTKVWEDNLTETICETLRIKGQTVESSFRIFDADSDGYVSYDDFRTTLLGTLKLRLREDEVTLYWSKLNLEHNKMTEREFTQKFGPYLESRKPPQTSTTALRDNLQKINEVLGKNTEELHKNVIDNKEVNKNAIESMALYMRKNNLGVLDLYKLIDQDRSNEVTRVELGKFFRVTGTQLNDRQLDQLIDTFDKDKNGKIQFNEFVNELRPYLVERPQASYTVEEILKSLAAYMKTENMSVSSIFTALDKNGDGFLSRLELTDFLVRAGFTNNDARVKDVLNFFDRSRDERVSVKEFVDVITPYLQKAQQQAATVTQRTPQQASPVVEQLRKKVRDLVKEHYNNLKQVFHLYREGSTSFVSKDNFKKVLIDLKVGLTPSEITLVLENFVDINGKNEVNWETFLSTFNDSDNLGASMAQSQIVSESRPEFKRSNTTEDIFRKISKILKDQRISKKDAFAIFDSDRSGKISHQEFKNAFNKGMKLNLSDEELNSMIRAIDKDNNGLINYNEFIAALNL